MWKPLAGMLLGLTLIALPTSAAEPQEKSPDIGFDYETFFQEHMSFVEEGKGDKAIEILTKRMPKDGGFSEEFKENLKRRLALMYGVAGKFLDREIVGYKRISSRHIRFYTVSHFEKISVTNSYLFYKGGNGQWVLAAYTITDGIEELDKVSPLTRFKKTD